MRISDWSSDVCSSDLDPGEITTGSGPGRGKSASDRLGGAGDGNQSAQANNTSHPETACGRWPDPTGTAAGPLLYRSGNDAALLAFAREHECAAADARHSAAPRGCVRGNVQ